MARITAPVWLAATATMVPSVGELQSQQRDFMSVQSSGVAQAAGFGSLAPHDS